MEKAALSARTLQAAAGMKPTMPRLLGPMNVPPGTVTHKELRAAIKSRREKKAMDPITSALFSGFSDELVKCANPDFAPGVMEKGLAMLRKKAPHMAKFRETGKAAAGPAEAVAKAAPAAEGLAQKLVGAIRRRPVMAAATAAAAGAGAATGVAEVKKRKEEQERRRAEIRQLLMSRLAAAGYAG